MDEFRAARRIAIVGPSGAGKTTLAKRLGPILELPVVHLDPIYYASGWQGVDEQAWEEILQALAAEERWIMEGNYAAPLGPRLLNADRVLFLDFRSSICAIRTIRRWWVSRWSQPADLPRGMRHRLNPRLVWCGLRGRHLPVPAALSGLLQGCPERVERIHTSAEARALVEVLEGQVKARTPGTTLADDTGQREEP